MACCAGCKSGCVLRTDLLCTLLAIARREEAKQKGGGGGDAGLKELEAKLMPLVK